MNLFIISPQRSGSTLLRLLLNGVEGITIPNETHFFSQRGFSEENWSKKFWEKTRLNYEEVKNFSRLSEIHEVLGGQDIVGDKTPENLNNLVEIVKTYGSAKFIFLYRDPKEIIFSLENRGWQGPFFINRYLYLHFYLSAIRDVIQMVDVHFVRYEDLVERPEKVIVDCCSFLGLQINKKEIITSFDTDNLADYEINTGIHESLLAGQITNMSRGYVLSSRQLSKLQKIDVKTLDELERFRSCNKIVYKLNRVLSVLFQLISKIVPRRVINYRRNIRLKLRKSE
jgi:hypothetical protein